MEDGGTHAHTEWKACKETETTVCEILMSTCHFLRFLGLKAVYFFCSWRFNPFLSGWIWDLK